MIKSTRKCCRLRVISDDGWFIKIHFKTNLERESKTFSSAQTLLFEELKRDVISFESIFSDGQVYS